jgi:hypothetical protein
VLIGGRGGNSLFDTSNEEAAIESITPRPHGQRR